MAIDWINPDWILQTVIGAFIGVLLGVPLSWWFARGSSRELSERANELKSATEETIRLQALALRALEGSGAIDQLARDEHGNPKGISHNLKTAIHIDTDAYATFQEQPEPQSAQTKEAPQA